MVGKGGQEPPAVGLIGLGRMGQAIACRLAHANLLVALWNRTPSTCDRLARGLGVAACRTPAELAARADVVITAVADGNALRAVYEGNDGVLAAMRPGLLCLEMSTVAPAQIKLLGDRVMQAGGSVVDAPVSGSVELARRGRLTILAGGDPASVARARPIFDVLGQKTFHLGALGCGSLMKLAVNNVVYGLNQSIAESLVLAERVGIDRAAAYGVFASSAVAAPFVGYRRALFERPGCEPVQMSAHLAIKDLELITELGRAAGVQLAQTAINKAALAEAIDDGWGDEDVTAVAAHLRARQEPLPSRPPVDCARVAAGQRGGRARDQDAPRLGERPDHEVRRTQ